MVYIHDSNLEAIMSGRKARIKTLRRSREPATEVGASAKAPVRSIDTDLDSVMDRSESGGVGIDLSRLSFSDQDLEPLVCSRHSGFCPLKVLFYSQFGLGHHVLDWSTLRSISTRFQ